MIMFFVVLGAAAFLAWGISIIVQAVMGIIAAARWRRSIR